MLIDEEKEKTEELSNDNVEVVVPSENKEEKITNEDNFSILKRALFIAIGVIGINIIATIVAFILLGAGFDKETIGGPANLITYSVLFVAIAGIVNIDVKKLKNTFKNYKNYIYGVAVFLILIGFSAIYTTFVSNFYQFSISDNERRLREFIPLYPAASIIIFGLIGPLCEEFTYRVGLFGILKKYKWAAYLVSSILFALAHFTFSSATIIDELVNLPIYLFSAVLLAYTYDKYGLAGSLTAHALNNIFSISMIALGNGK